MKKFMVYSRRILFFLALWCPSAFSQLLQIRPYSTGDGLPQSEVVSIYQDRLGYLWFGTYENGLARYDGRNFTRLSISDDMLSGAVHHIFQDRHGAMWIGTDDGLIRLVPNLERGDTTVSVFTKEHGLPDNRVTSIVEDAQGVLWIGTSRGACRLIDAQFTAKRTHHGSENNNIAAMALAKDGSVWMATLDGVNIWHEDTVRTLTTAEGLAHNRVRAVFCDRDGAIWLGTAAGLTRVHGNVLQTFGEKDGLYDTNIYTLAQDQQGNLWIGARSGLSKLVPRLASDADKSNAAPKGSSENRLFRHFDRRHGLSVDRVAALLVDYENNLWIGTLGGGVCKLKLYGGYIENYTPRNDLPVASVYSFLEDNLGRVWIGTNGGGLVIVDGDSLLVRDTRSGLPNNVVHALAQEPSGAIWIGTHGGAVRIPAELQDTRLTDSKKWQVFTTNNELPGDQITNIFCTPQGEVWLGTFAAGAICYTSGKFTALNLKNGLPSNLVHAIHQDRRGRLWFATDSGLVMHHGNTKKLFRRSDGLPSENIYCIFEDRAGHLWFGTRRGGAVRYEDGKFYTLSTTDGLSDNVVYFINEDRHQRLWFGTNAGVDRYSPEGENRSQAVHDSTTTEKRFFHLTVAHGLADNECNTRATLCDRNGNLWFGTAGGASRLSPDLLPPMTPSPRVHIQSIQIGNRVITPASLSPLDNLRLRAKTKTSITFHFIALSFIDERNISYQCFLEGFDDKWIDLANTNHVRYTNLSAGSYTFHLRGANAFGVSSSEAQTVRLKILPPYYRTPWFLIGSLFLVAGLIYGVHRLRVRHVHKRNAELEKAVEEKTHSLQEAHAFLSSIKDFLPVGLLVVDPKRFIVEVNRSCVELFGYTQNELHGQELHNLLTSEKLTRDALWSAICENLRPPEASPEKRSASDKSMSHAGIELLGLRRDGEEFPCLVHAVCVRNERGEIRYVILTCEDINEWKQLEQRVIENEKQLALVDLMAGMGDVLSNKLVDIQKYLELLKNVFSSAITSQGDGERDSRGSTSPLQVVKRAQHETSEMTSILNKLIEFSAYLTKIPVLPVDLRDLLCALQRRWSKALQVQIPDMPAPIPVKVIPKIKDGLDEAMRNSQEAEATQVLIHVETLTNFSRVRFTLTDNGRGVSPEHVSKVFLPFFKTKGTPHPGLGLWKLRQVVQQSGGTVEIIGIPHGGTQLVITLPMATVEQLSDDAAAQAAALAEYAA